MSNPNYTSSRKNEKNDDNEDKKMPSRPTNHEENDDLKLQSISKQDAEMEIESNLKKQDTAESLKSKVSRKQSGSFTSLAYAAASRNNVASAKASSSNSPSSRDIDPSSNEKLKLLLDRISHYYDAHHQHHRHGSYSNTYHHIPQMDPRRAYYLLEASAGNVDLALTLYWDDFVASSSTNISMHGTDSNQRSNKYLSDIANSSREVSGTSSDFNHAEIGLSINETKISRSSKPVGDTTVPEHEKKKSASKKRKVHEMETNQINESNKLQSSAKPAVSVTYVNAASASAASATATAASASATSNSVTRKPNPSKESDNFKDNYPYQVATHPNNNFVPRRPPLRRLFPDMQQQEDAQGLKDERIKNIQPPPPSNELRLRIEAALSAPTVFHERNNHLNPIERILRRTQIRRGGNNRANNNNESNSNNHHPNVEQENRHLQEDEEIEVVESNQNSVSISDDEAAASAKFIGNILKIKGDDFNDDNEDDTVDEDLDEDSQRDRHGTLSVTSLRRMRTKRILRNRLRKARDGYRKRLKEGSSHENNNNDDADSNLKPLPKLDNEEIDEADLSESDSAFSSEDIADITSNPNAPSPILWGSRKEPILSDSEEPQQSKQLSIIPTLWMNASFSSSPSLNGLNIDVIDTSKTSQKILSSQCGGLSVLTSLVTALIQSGASIQGKIVTCSKARTRFSDLSKVEKAQQFQSRLVDALSSILHVAATSAIKYHMVNAEKKKKRLKKSGKEQLMEEEEKIMQRALRKDLKLCSVCKWQEDSSDSNPHSFGGKVLSTSLTNILDLRSYVISHLDAFMNPGGCALFLETVIKIHGVKRIKRMLRACGSQRDCLLSCNCGNTPIPKGSAKLEWQNYLEHECFSVELLSLLMTGKIRSSYKRWDKSKLGIGILSLNQLGKEEGGKEFLNPVKPVWLVRGEKCFSTLWFEDESDYKKTHGNGSTFKVIHWNCWSSGRKTVLKIITSRDTPGIKDSNTSSLNIGLINANLDNIRHDLDDEHFYPNEYKRWRFAFDSSDDNSQKVKEDKIEIKSFTCVWIPYYKLCPRQKEIIDMKYAPKINRVLWCRWKDARVSQCTPSILPVV